METLYFETVDGLLHSEKHPQKDVFRKKNCMHLQLSCIFCCPCGSDLILCMSREGSYSNIWDRLVGASL
ncbi:hypothetical protein SUGI_0890140 [Cryptomeria japonica]|nr:hypothetical protein SUGI_0890140 [Cryptomeria japonica]